MGSSVHPFSNITNQNLGPEISIDCTVRITIGANYCWTSSEGRFWSSRLDPCKNSALLTWTGHPCFLVVAKHASSSTSYFTLTGQGITCPDLYQMQMRRTLYRMIWGPTLCAAAHDGRIRTATTSHKQALGDGLENLTPVTSGHEHDDHKQQLSLQHTFQAIGSFFKQPYGVRVLPFSAGGYTRAEMKQQKETGNKVLCSALYGSSVSTIILIPSCSVELVKRQSLGWQTQRTNLEGQQANHTTQI
ncbi:hypothetical protein F5884DRAFT_393062 [Xylogone sp. PMI_703]|nr:hypothetical protein F5884DRAFT_393062 [Xylogone sp. PMI_703]